MPAEDIAVITVRLPINIKTMIEDDAYERRESQNLWMIKAAEQRLGIAEEDDA